MLDMMEDPEATKRQTVLVSFNNVDFSINRKQLFCNLSCALNMVGKTVIMGANGAGKSLFLRLIAGLLKPDSGEVAAVLKNRTGKGSTNEVARISMVFQNPVLLRRSTFANVAYVLKQQNHTKHAILQSTNKALVMAQLDQHANTPARRLSGGEQQRLALARALVVEPDILLLDEATANLDPASTFIVEKMIDEVSSKGTKVVLVTHDVRQAKRVADDILFIHKGRIMAHKPVKNFFRDPGSKEAQAYLDGRVPNQNLQE